MRSSLITTIILLISAFVLFLGTRTDVKPQRHLRGYFAGLLLVSIPSAIWLLWQKSMGNIELNGPIFGLTLNVILALILLPFVGLYLWGLVKKFVGDKQLSILLPIFGIGIFGGFALILLINGATGFAKFSAMSALIACVVILFTKLLFTARFWSFQVLLIVIWFIVSLVASIFGHKLFGKMLNVNTLLVLISFMNVFLVVFDWFDDKKTYLAEEDLSLNNDNIEYSTKAKKIVTAEATETKQFASAPTTNGVQSGNNVTYISKPTEESVIQTEYSNAKIGFPQAQINNPKAAYNSKVATIALAGSNTIKQVNTAIELPKPVQQNISRPIVESNVKTKLQHDTHKFKQNSANFQLAQNSIDNNKSKESLADVENLGVNNEEVNPAIVPAEVTNNKPSLKDAKRIKNDEKQKSSKFRIPRVHFISRLLRFSSGSDVDQLTKENNDFKMPVFGSTANHSKFNSQEREPEFSINIRTGKTTIINGTDATGSNNIQNDLPKIKSDLNMPRANFAIKSDLKKSIDQQVKKRKYITTKTSKNKGNKHKKSTQTKANLTYLNNKLTAPNPSSRVTASLLSISKIQPRQKRSAQAKDFSANRTTTLNVETLSKIVGRYNSSSVGKYINKANLAIPYRSQETLDKIVAYKNSLLKRMTFRNAKRLTYIGKEQDNLLIDRLHRTTRPLSINKIY